MIIFLSGMAAGAALLTGIFKLRCMRWDRMERNARRRAKRAAQSKETRGFCGNLSKNNDWMTQELPKL